MFDEMKGLPMSMVAMRHIRNVHGEMIVTWNIVDGRHVVTTEYDDVSLAPTWFATHSMTDARDAYTRIGRYSHPELAGYEVLAEEVSRPDILTPEAAIPGVSVVIEAS